MEKYDKRKKERDEAKRGKKGNDMFYFSESYFTKSHRNV